MEDNKSSTLLSTVAIIIAVGAVVYFASKGKGRSNNSTNSNATSGATPTATATPAVAPPTHALMGDTSNYAIIEAINNGLIPSPPQATGWYWNGSEWYPSTQSATPAQQYIPTLANGSEIPAPWLFKAPLTISGNTPQGVPVVHAYKTGDTVLAVYNSGATPMVTPPAGTPNMGSSLTWSDSFGNFMLAGDTNIDTYLIPPLI